MTNEDEKIKEAGKKILQKALSDNEISIADIESICKRVGISSALVFQKICAYLTEHDSAGMSRLFRLNQNGREFIANGYWEKEERESRKLFLETKYLDDAVRYSDCNRRFSRAWVIIAAIALLLSIILGFLTL